MARLIAGIAAFLMPLAGFAQRGQDREAFQEAGVCARCHVISVVEWGMSAHRKASTGCTSCHGASLGHVQDERNNVKPDRVPTGAAVRALCVGCHTNQKNPKPCQDCHHYHALVDPRKPAAAAVAGESEARQREYARFLEQGEKLAQAGQWDQARTAFQSALRQKPDDGPAGARLKACEHRLKPGLAGFEITEPQFDPGTGLARTVRVAGFGIPMVLVPGGEFEMGSERYRASQPVHTVRVPPLYLGEFEITQAEWTKVMGSNPSAHQGGKFPDAARMPVEQVSWEDAQAFIQALNAKVPGAGFRLPTEAEWEFAARMGRSEPDPPAPGTTSPLPVDRGRPNALGLYGMLGNVWEWCSSFSRSYPFDAADGRESAEGAGLRILRGGGFADPPDLLDPAFRHAERPGRRFGWNGLRLARDVPEPR